MNLNNGLLSKALRFSLVKGTHIRVFLNGRQSVLPMHDAELKIDTIEYIKKRLGLN